MDTMKNIASSYEANSEDVVSWCTNLYDTKFSSYFAKQRILYERLQSKDQPITDIELEEILTAIPLELFQASEAVSQLRIRHEVVKIGIKEKMRSVELASTASTATAKKEEASDSVLGDQLLLLAYGTILDRVEKEISFSRELIMSAKKIWDARRRTEDSMPAKGVVISEMSGYSSVSK